MKIKRSNSTTGFTILEMIIVIAIIAIVTTIIVSSFFGFRDKSLLDGTTDDLVSLLQEARNATLSSRDYSNYGVRIEGTRLVFFKGSTFSDGASTNKIVDLDGRLRATTTLIGRTSTGANVVFTRLTGATSNIGTTTIYLERSTTTNKKIYVGSTGVIERK